MIDVRCSHCGFSTRVSPQYAGKSGSCPRCGEPMPVPLPDPAVAPPAPARGRGVAVWVVASVVLVAALCVLPIGGAIVGLFAFRSSLTAVGPTRAVQSQAENNLKQIGLALHNYHDAHGSFPPPYVADENGTPLYSWRVLLLPYLEQAAAYDAFDKNASWDSPQNAVITGTQMAAYCHPEDAIVGTSYFMPTGVGLIAEPGKAIRLADVTDGTSNTVLVVDAGYPIGPWTAPTDPSPDAGSAYTIGDGSVIQPRDGKITVLFADGSVQTFEADAFPLMQLQSMFTRAGGEVVNRY